MLAVNLSKNLHFPTSNANMVGCWVTSRNSCLGVSRKAIPKGFIQVGIDLFFWLFAFAISDVKYRCDGWELQQPLWVCEEYWQRELQRQASSGCWVTTCSHLPPDCLLHEMCLSPCNGFLIAASECGSWSQTSDSNLSIKLQKDKTNTYVVGVFLRI